MYKNRLYGIISTSEINKINFSSVYEESRDTLRFSVDGSKTFVKWNKGIKDENVYKIINPETNEYENFVNMDPESPQFIETLTTFEGPYTHEEILTILATPEWTNTEEEI